MLDSRESSEFWPWSDTVYLKLKTTSIVLVSFESISVITDLGNNLFVQYNKAYKLILASIILNSISDTTQSAATHSAVPVLKQVRQRIGSTTVQE